MIKSQYTQILIATLSQCLFFLYPLSGSTGLLFVIFYLCPLPLYVIGLMHGWKIALLIAIISSAIISFSALSLAQAYALIFALPSVYFCYLIGLNKKSESGNEDILWYPLSLVISKILIISICLAIIGIFFLGTNISDYQNSINAIYSNIYEIRPEIQQTIQLNTIELLSASLPVLFIIFWVLIFVCNLWISLKFVKILGYLKRPWSNFDQINLPKDYIYFLLIFLILSYFSDGIFKIISISITFAILVGYSIGGLSIIHNVSKNIRLRPLLLTSIYTLILVFVPFIIPITILGILNYKKNVRDIIKKRR